MIHDADAARAAFARWLADPDTWIGVFEDKIIDPRRSGQRIALAFDRSQYDDASIGDRAPDTKTFIGWPYHLVAKCETVEEAMKAMRFTEELPDDLCAVAQSERNRARYEAEAEAFGLTIEEYEADVTRPDQLSEDDRDYAARVAGGDCEADNRDWERDHLEAS